MSVKKSLLALAVVVSPLVLAAPALLVAADKPVSAAKTTGYAVDAGASKITWVGKKVTGQHNGTISIQDGDLRVAGGNVVGGSFIIDARSITVEDQKGESKAKLTGHLKSDDFFGVEKYPTISFEITKISPAETTPGASHDVTGNLTIKGQTHPVTFPARIDVKGNRVTAEARNIPVDRTLYGIRYGSGKFFENLGDKAISDEFWIDVKLAAKK